MNFGKLQLNDEIKTKLSSAVDGGTLSHAVLLTGGTEKERKALATHLSAALFCESGNKPCMKCSSCKKIKDGVHPDIIVVTGNSEKRTSIPVQTIRDIRSKAYIMPNEAPFQIFIILEASGMGDEAQNALLKILEEPPDTARFILTARSRDDFRQTILSRVSCFAISEDSGQAAGEKENAKAAEAAERILNALLTKNEFKIMLGTAVLEKDKKTFKACCETMILKLRNAIVARYGVKNDSGATEKKLSDCFTDSEMLKMIEVLKNLMADADRFANDNLLLTRLAFGLYESIHK